nr:(+)-neomenthol dehydrogenase-like isoform X5 [Ziziphus jujuba var. spinosa]
MHSYDILASSMVKFSKHFLECAVVTGANKGIGLEAVKQLASNGINVVLTARDENRGLEAVEKLKEFELSGEVLFHQLDVADPASIAYLADFIKTQFGKLDILPMGGKYWDKIAVQTDELTKACLEINYYGARRMVEALLPLLQLSQSPSIVNVSSFLGLLENIPNEWAKGVLNDVERLTEERVNEVLNEFVKDFKQGNLEAKGWPTHIAAYILSKAAMNAYTRILAKKFPNFYVNSVCPGYVKTDMTCNTGLLTVSQGAQIIVTTALLPPNDKSSGLFISHQGVLSF